MASTLKTKVARHGSRRLDADGLTPREALFCAHYIANKGNGKQASKLAGYGGDLTVRASQLLARPQVAAVIERSRTEILDELAANAKRVLLELVRIAFLDPRKLFKPDGSLIPISELDLQTAAALGGLDFKDGALTKVRFCSKNSALQLLGLWLKMWDGAGNFGKDRLHEIIEALRGDA
jgi:phage terminase small subunit